MKLNEWIFILAGLCMIIFMPFLAAGGFYLWGIAKMIYLIGLIVYVGNRNI